MFSGGAQAEVDTIHGRCTEAKAFLVRLRVFPDNLEPLGSRPHWSMRPVAFSVDVHRHKRRQKPIRAKARPATPLRARRVTYFGLPVSAVFSTASTSREVRASR